MVWVVAVVVAVVCVSCRVRGWNTILVYGGANVGGRWDVDEERMIQDRMVPAGGTSWTRTRRSYCPCWKHWALVRYAAKFNPECHFLDHWEGRMDEVVAAIWNVGMRN